MNAKPPSLIQSILIAVAWMLFFGALTYVWIELPKWLLG